MPVHRYEMEYEDLLVERLVNIVSVHGGMGHDQLYLSVKNIQPSRIVVYLLLQELVDQGFLYEKHGYYYLGW